MKKKIAILSGDGIGKEVMPQTLRVLDAITKKFDFHFEFLEGDIGGEAFDKYGEHFPLATRAICEQADAILFGSVGGPVPEAHLPKWQNCETNSILALRKSLSLGINIRPIKIYPALMEKSPLKEAYLQQVDFVIIRELAGDIYFGAHEKYTENNLQCARDIAQYSEQQIALVAHAAFQLAQTRHNKVTSVDKANVLATSQLWRETVTKISHQYPTVTLEHMLVDNCALQFFIKPSQFDVIVTSNLFGDILSDAAAGIPGSLGLIPSASLNDNQVGLFEPAGGSAPDIAGKNKANPIAQFLSAAMMFRFSFARPEVAEQIEQAISATLAAGFFTADIATGKSVGTREFSEEVIQRI